MNDTVVMKISENDASLIVQDAKEIVELNNEVISFLEGLYAGGHDYSVISYAKKLSDMSHRVKAISTVMKMILSGPGVEMLDEFTEDMIEV